MCHHRKSLFSSPLSGVRSMHSTDIQWSAILSWGYTDNMLRLKSKQSEPPINFIQCSPLHQVRVVNTANILGLRLDSFQLNLCLTHISLYTFCDVAVHSSVTCTTPSTENDSHKTKHSSQEHVHITFHP